MPHIRPFALQDYAEAWKLWSETGGVGLNDYDDSEAGIARYLARNPRTSFVAVEDGRLAGTLLAGHDGRRGFLYHLVVREGLRGRGAGKALVEAALSALAAEGLSKAALVVFADNAIGNGFWESVGFGRRNDLVYRNRKIGG